MHLAVFTFHFISCFSSKGHRFLGTVTTQMVSYDLLKIKNKFGRKGRSDKDLILYLVRVAFLSHPRSRGCRKGTVTVTNHTKYLPEQNLGDFVFSPHLFCLQLKPKFLLFRAETGPRSGCWPHCCVPIKLQDTC